MAERFSITLEKEHKQAVQRFQRRVGVKTFSGALQAIIHQFDAQQKAVEADKQPADTAQPTAA